MCSLSQLGAHSNQCVCTLPRTAYKLPGKTCSIIEYAWNYRWRLSFPGCRYLGWDRGAGSGDGLCGQRKYLVCLVVGYAVAACAQPTPVRSVAFYGMLLVEGDQVWWVPPATCVCVGQVPLASLPRLVYEES